MKTFYAVTLVFFIAGSIGCSNSNDQSRQKVEGVAVGDMSTNIISENELEKNGCILNEEDRASYSVTCMPSFSMQRQFSQQVSLLRYDQQYLGLVGASADRSKMPKQLNFETNNALREKWVAINRFIHSSSHDKDSFYIPFGTILLSKVPTDSDKVDAVGFQLLLDIALYDRVFASVKDDQVELTLKNSTKEAKLDIEKRVQEFSQLEFKTTPLRKNIISKVREELNKYPY